MYYFKAVVFAVAVAWEGGNGQVVMTWIAMVKSAFHKLKNLFSTKLDLNLRKTLSAAFGT
jgi:hypothetical protein